MNKIIAPFLSLLLMLLSLGAAAQNQNERVANIFAKTDDVVQIEVRPDAPAVIVFVGVDSVSSVVGKMSSTAANATGEGVIDGWSIRRVKNTIYVLPLADARKPTILVRLSDDSIRILDLVVGNKKTNKYIIRSAASLTADGVEIQAKDDKFMPTCNANLYVKVVVEEKVNISPIHVCDDGKLTYFQFEDKTPYPNIYRGQQGTKTETLVNRHAEKNGWVVMHGIVDSEKESWNLRMGESMVGIFQKGMLATPMSSSGGKK